MPPANPTLATATAATAWIDNDYLGLDCQVIDLDVICLGDGQRHGIRNFGRDSPTVVPTPATATTAPGRIFVSIARRLIAAMSFLLRSNAFFEPAEATTSVT